MAFPVIMTPWFGAQVKYLTPLTVPSLSPCVRPNHHQHGCGSIVCRRKQTAAHQSFIQDHTGILVAEPGPAEPQSGWPAGCPASARVLARHVLGELHVAPEGEDTAATLSDLDAAADPAGQLLILPRCHQRHERATPERKTGKGNLLFPSPVQQNRAERERKTERDG